MFDSARNNLVGRRTRRVIQLGEKLTVQVALVLTTVQKAGGLPPRASTETVAVLRPAII